MRYKLPIDVRRNYTTKTFKSHFHLKCDNCGETFDLLKPAHGAPFYDDNALMTVRRHISRHSETPHPEDKSYLYRVVGFDTANLVAIPGTLGNDEKVDRVVVQSLLGTYMVVVSAANLKHARLIGGRLIRQYQRNTK